MRTTWEVYQGRNFSLRINVTGLTVSNFDSAKAEVREYPGGTVLATLALGSGITKQTTAPLNALDLLIEADTTSEAAYGSYAQRLLS